MGGDASDAVGRHQDDGVTEDDSAAEELQQPGSPSGAVGAQFGQFSLDCRI